jgi:flagellar basal-body rod protein FlgF
MNSGLYTAFSGMRAQMDALDIISNNLANINTAGFKEEKTFFTVLDNAMNAGKTSGNNSMVQARSTMATADGSPLLTHRDLDVALTGNGFLVVNTPQGVRYTRNGQLSVNAKSTLCAAGGFPVVGASGKPIVLGPGQITINDQGDIYQDGARVDQMKIAAFDDPTALVKEGNSLLAPANTGVEPKPSDAKVRQGYLEQSNVNTVTCVVGLVGIMRQYEALQKCINVLMNDVNAKAIDKLSK